MAKGPEISEEIGAGLGEVAPDTHADPSLSRLARIRCLSDRRGHSLIRDVTRLLTRPASADRLRRSSIVQSVVAPNERYRRAPMRHAARWRTISACPTGSVTPSSVRKRIGSRP